MGGLSALALVSAITAVASATTIKPLPSPLANGHQMTKLSKSPLLAAAEIAVASVTAVPTVRSDPIARSNQALTGPV